MRTRAEVVKYLKDKGFYDMLKRRIPFPIEKFPTEELYLHEFFMRALDWDYSKEGRDYWRKVNAEFLEWYGEIPEPTEYKRRKTKELI